MDVVQLTGYFVRELKRKEGSAGVAEPTAQPTSMVFSNVTKTSFDVSFTAAVGGADLYLAVRRTSASPTFVPSDLTGYTLGEAVGDGEVRHFGAGLTFSETGLSAYTEYFYDIFSCNGGAGTYNYLTTSPLENSQRTLSGSLLFDKSNDYVQLSNTTFLEGATTCSFSFWYKNTAATFDSIMRVFSKMNSSANSFGVGWAFFDTNSYIIYVGNGTLRYKLFKGITNQNTWQHYGGVVELSNGAEADKIRLYNGGVRKTPTTVVTPSPATIGVNGIAARIGMDNFAVTNPLGGYLKNFCIWSDAVDQNVIDMAADINATPNPTNLIRHWKCNDISPSTTMIDSTGNENGVPTNFDFNATSDWKDYP